MSTASNVHGVRVIGDILPILDETRNALYELVSGAPDRSSQSDDLGAHIIDWASRYNFSRLRSNILLPLQIDPGARVLDVGCGTGPLTRALAERGARVTGLDSSLARAQVAAARTSGLTNCDIVGGTLADYIAEGHDGEFDIVLLCGVLGNTSYDHRVFENPAETLEHSRRLLKPNGSVVVALENQLGLKYLLGYPEDRRGIPWVGIDGYRSGRNPARTWSRAGLASLLSDAGLVEQRWLFPYPDHMLPNVVVRSELFDDPEGRQLLELFVRTPVKDYTAGSMLVADPVAAFRTTLAAGIGPDTANAFLVVAGAEGSNPSAHLGPGDLWISSSDRKSELMEQRSVERRDGRWTLVSRNDRPEVHVPPLVSRRSDSPVILGSNLEDEIVAQAAQVRSPRDLHPLLAEWWGAATPWLAQGEYHLDVMPRNFIRNASGELTYIDREWLWTDESPESWALLRSMWILVLDRLWPAGATAGLSWSLTLREMVLALARVVDPNTSRQQLAEAVALEAQLQTRVTGNAEDKERAGLEELLNRPVTLLSERPPLAQILERPLIAEADAADRERSADMRELQATDDIIGNMAELESLRWQVRDLDAKVVWLRGRDMRNQVQRARHLAGRVKRRLIG